MDRKQQHGQNKHLFICQESRRLVEGDATPTYAYVDYIAYTHTLRHTTVIQMDAV